MKKPLIIRPEVLQRLAAMARADNRRCWETIATLIETFGRPHVHAGIGIRKLGPGLFECRTDLKLRILFRDRPDGIDLFFIGNHDEVQRLLRSEK